MRFLSHSIVFLRQTSRSLEKSRKTLLLLQLMYFIKYFISVLQYKFLVTTCIGQSIVYEIRIHKMKKKIILKTKRILQEKALRVLIDILSFVTFCLNIFSYGMPIAKLLRLLNRIFILSNTTKSTLFLIMKQKYERK